MLCCRFYRLCWGQLLQNIFCKVLLSHVSGFFTIISVFFCYFFKPLFSLFSQAVENPRQLCLLEKTYLAMYVLVKGRETSCWKS